MSQDRLIKALAREGIQVERDGSLWRVRSIADPNAIPCDILLGDLPVEQKALTQILAVAGLSHPLGGKARRVVGTPDFHPGSGGVPIGTVVQYDGCVATLAGKDICCGMRMHTTDLTVSQFQAGRDKLVQLLKGDFFGGTRDIPQSGYTQQGMFQYGLQGWCEEQRSRPLGRTSLMDFKQTEKETLSVYTQGMLSGSSQWAPEGLVPSDLNQVIRDDGIATIGGSNHFCEVQYVDEVLDSAAAYHLGIRTGQVCWMVHTGSRFVGQYVGQMWADLSRVNWPATVPYPESKIFPLPVGSDLYSQYLEAEATASNYGFVNRMLVSELVRLRFREVWGDVEAPMVVDLPHNITLQENGGLVTRKGACPAHVDQPLLIPGSMGSSSYLALGLGSEKHLCSASHGAGRAVRRGDTRDMKDLGLEGVDCISMREERKIEEAPAAYKDIDQVIALQVQAGIIKLVARMRPILTFKA